MDLLSSCVGMQTYRSNRVNTETFLAQSSGTEVNNCALDVDDIHHHSSPPCRALLWHEMLKKRIQGVALLSPYRDVCVRNVPVETCSTENNLFE